MKKTLIYTIMTFCLLACDNNANTLQVEVYETSAAGKKVEKISPAPVKDTSLIIELLPQQTKQTLIGFGGAFTESSAYLINKLSSANRTKILQAYFSEEGANYSFTRTHIGSFDFSLSNYSYAPVDNDMDLAHFSVQEDKDDIIPMIKDALAISKEGFKILASPWTAPKWMKDNNNWVGGKLLPKYNDTWALYFSKYIQAYKEEGIDIWGITVINEPHGNGNNWESMLMTPKEMTDFVVDFLGPKLEKDGFGHVQIFGYDQNRAGLKEWVDEMFRDQLSSKYYAGTAIHWYESTFDYFPEALQYAHNKAPQKHLIQAEACCDAEVPHWQEDSWYWSKEGTDWGWDWASAEDKHLHPKYVPVFRYARDIIGCLNNWVDGWIDWNMVLDTQGGPNWFQNWCLAPVIVKPETDEVYFTPLYYTMAHFSKFIRPGAKVIAIQQNDDSLMVTAAQNPDNSIAVVVLNQNETPKSFKLKLNDKSIALSIDGKALQTVVIAGK